VYQRQSTLTSGQKAILQLVRETCKSSGQNIFFRHDLGKDDQSCSIIQKLRMYSQVDGGREVFTSTCPANDVTQQLARMCQAEDGVGGKSCVGTHINPHFRRIYVPQGEASSSKGPNGRRQISHYELLIESDETGRHTSQTVAKRHKK
jgi:hypothetical protein